jgi:hypothetical protein
VYELSEVMTVVASSMGELGDAGLMSWIVKFEGSVLTAYSALAFVGGTRPKRKQEITYIPFNDLSTGGSPSGRVGR